MLKAAALLMVVSAFIVLPGCNDCCECDYLPAPAQGTSAAPIKTESAQAKMPKVTGKWEGRWETEGPGGHGTARGGTAPGGVARPASGSVLFISDSGAR